MKNKKRNHQLKLYIIIDVGKKNKIIKQVSNK